MAGSRQTVPRSVLEVGGDMDPVHYLKILRRRWVVVVLAPLLAIAAGWVTAPRGGAGRIDPQLTYSATHTLLQEATADSGNANGGAISLGRVQLFATTGEIPRRVVERLGLDTDPAVLASQVTVSGDAEVGTVTVTVQNRDGDRAAAVANTFAEEIVAYFNERLELRRQQELERTLELIQQHEQRARELTEELQGLPEESADAQFLVAERSSVLQQHQYASDRYQELLAQGSATMGYVTLQKATPVPVYEGGFHVPQSQGSRATLAGLLGLLLGVGLSLVLDRIDTRIRSRHDAERSFGLPVVAEIPHLTGRMRAQGPIVTVADPASPAAEAFRILRLSLQLMPRWILPQATPAVGEDGIAELRSTARAGQKNGGPAKVVLVTSAGPAEGKTTTVANLAASFAEGGRSVLVVDCDFRGGDLNEYYGVPGDRGVQDFLEAEADGTRPSLDGYIQDTGLSGVRVMPCGSSRAGKPVELVAAGRRLLRTAASAADVVIVDAGPILAVNDPAALIPGVDAVVVVCRNGRTTADAAERTSELLGRVKASVLGVVFVGVPGDPLAGSSTRRPVVPPEWSAPAQPSAGAADGD